MRRGDEAGWRISPVRAAIRRCWLAISGVGVFSGVINLLALTGSFYMLQVYDRVLTSRSIPTLVGLTVLMAGLYAVNGVLDFLRVRVMSRVGVRIDDELREQMFAAVQLLPLRVRQGGDGLQPIRDLDQSAPSCPASARRRSSTCRGSRSISPSSTCCTPRSAPSALPGRRARRPDHPDRHAQRRP